MRKRGGMRYRDACFSKLSRLPGFARRGYDAGHESTFLLAIGWAAASGGQVVGFAGFADSGAGTASVALARQDEPDEVIVDARMEGYATNMEMPEGSSGGTWVVFVLLTVITAGGLLKDAKRTHLD